MFQSWLSNIHCWMISVNQRDVVEASSVGTRIEPADSMNTITQPEAMPGLACGRITRQCVRHHGEPRSSAASIWLVSSDWMAL